MEYIIKTFEHNKGYIANISSVGNLKALGYGKGYSKQEAIDAANEWIKQQLKQ
jgi:dsRNA-specific ribonuclease